MMPKVTYVLRNGELVEKPKPFDWSTLKFSEPSALLAMIEDRRAMVEEITGMFPPTPAPGQVSIQESGLGDRRWAVLITRQGERIPTTLWGRYATQKEAVFAERDAKKYLRGECAACGGSGSDAMDEDDRCGECFGSGRDRSRPTSPPAGDR